MTFKSHLIHFFKHRILAPQINRQDRWEQRVVDMPAAVRGDENSPSRFSIPRASIALEDDRFPLPGFPNSVPQMAGSTFNIRKSIFDLEKNPANGKKRFDDPTIDELRDFAISVGASTIGYCKVPQEWVFRNLAIRYTNAIVLTLEMDKARMDVAPNQDTAVMVHETYNQLGQVANKIAEWLRAHGFAAHAGHPLGGLALYPPMAQSAGLGWRGMSGLLITPEFGPRVRLAAVFTEIENFPVHKDDEHKWILDFCQTCKRCLRECPANAFYDEPINQNNGLVTVLDNARCFPYFARNHGCSVCIKVCPFNQQEYNKIKTGFMTKQNHG